MKRRACWATGTSPKCRWCPRWPTRRSRCSASCTTLPPRPSPSPRRTWKNSKTFAKAELGLDTLEPWDVAYASEKLRQARYAYSDQEVKQYFPEPKVLDGLFGVIRTLYRVERPPRRGAELGPGRALLPHREGGCRGSANSSATSTSTCMHAAPSAAARGWTRRAAATATPGAATRRWPTWCATSPARWAANPPPSPTMTC